MWANTDKGEAIIVLRRKDDPYGIDQVIDASINVATGTAGMLANTFGGLEMKDGSKSGTNHSKDSNNSAKSVKSELNEFTLTFTKLLGERMSQAEKATQNELAKMYNLLANRSGPNLPQSERRFTSMNTSTNAFGSPLLCFYCREPGHFVMACLVREEDEKLGRIKMLNGRIVYPDGSEILHSKDQSIKDAVRQKSVKFQSTTGVVGNFYHQASAQEHEIMQLHMQLADAEAINRTQLEQLNQSAQQQFMMEYDAQRSVLSLEDTSNEMGGEAQYNVSTRAQAQKSGN